jgi:hypothetical protein
MGNTETETVEVFGHLVSKDYFDLVNEHGHEFPAGGCLAGDYPEGVKVIYEI